jgi:hypothetical protein
MLKFLDRRIHRSSILIILTFCDDEISSQRLLPRLTVDLPANVTVRLALAPLSQASVDQMAQRSERQPEELYAVTGGNPFFVTQLLESEISEVPASVRDLVLTRVSQPSPTGKELAEIAAPTPGGTAFWLMDRIFPNAAALLDECVNQGVLTINQDRLAYRHELARRAVEDSLSPGRARLGVHREAAAHYRIALNQLISLPQITRAELLEGLSFEGYLTGDIDTVLQTRKQAMTIWKNVQRADKEGDNLRWLSRLFWFGGKRKEAERYAQEAVDILEKLQPGVELAMAYSNLSQL